MTTAILGIGNAVPAHRMSQAESLQMFQDIVCEDKKQKRLAHALFTKAGVENRHTCVPHELAYHWCPPSQAAGDADSLTTAVQETTELQATLPAVQSGQSPGPTTEERMQMYAQFAGDLAVEAACEAVQDAGVEAASITHLVTVSCTGFDAPGVDLELIQRLGLRPTTQRIHVGFMGCHAAINGLRAASGLAASNRQNRVLLVAVELCSLHYRFQWDTEGIVGNALFADGAAAVMLGRSGSERTDEPGGPRESLPNSRSDLGGEIALLDTGSCVLPNSREAMSWRVGNHGFDMLLTSQVGDHIEVGLRDWLSQWLAAQGCALADIDLWGVHPGGPRILSAVETALDLDPGDLATSREILARHGNMSSPTVLFILREFLERRRLLGSDKAANCLLLGFGPGLVAEVALLRMSRL